MFANGQGKKQKTGGLGPEYRDANAPELSRDGTRVAFWAGFEGQIGEIWTMNTDGSDPRRVTETANPRTSDDPVWSPHGRRIVFGTNRDGPIQVWGIRPDGSDLRLFIPDSAGGLSWQAVFALCQVGTKTPLAPHRLVGVPSACIDAYSYRHYHRGDDSQTRHRQSAR